MKKVILGLVVALACVGGCLEIETHEEQGFIQISGGNVNVQEAIMGLMRDRGWQHEQAGSENSSVSSKGPGLFSMTKREDTTHSWTHVRTSDGKLVQFEVTTATGRPAEVRINVEEGAAVSTAEVTADLARRLRQGTRTKRAGEPLAIRIDSFTRNTAEPNVCTGNWTATGDWAYPGGYLRLEVRQEGGNVQHHSLYVEGAAPWKDSGNDDGAIHFRLERPAGVMAFEGRQSSGGGSGTVTFRPNAAYIGELSKLLNTSLDVDDAVTLFVRNLDLDYARQMKEAFGAGLTLDNLLALSNFHISPDYVKGVRQAGYKFSTDEIVRLNNFHIGLDMLNGFKRAGYDYSVDELIRINNFHLKVEQFTAFREAGYNFSIDEMIRANNFHIPIETARALHEAGFRYSLDELIRLNNFHIPPDYIVAFKQGGYDMSLDDLIRARNFHINAADAAGLKKMGYDFSLEDLIRLQNFHVSTEFMAQVHDPQYENFTADELIEFQQKRLSAEAINKIRASKRKVQPQASDR
jgi:hypothetical protein